ncbi:type VI secretion system Vgr family protein [uncultured Paraglaciecola sp.]|uniref:type VI secretion system Vgr family protein n=1 Tax=uncultured Paraglaciecola sp. TaxID=1765024 RepID=UPI002602330A|nr:phage late control D family protein [uncultured Paraglaciecola sp.]
MSQFHFRFTYQKNGVKNDSLTLLKFSGQETISHLFNFEIELKSSNINLDEDSILNQPCSIEIYYGDQAKPIRIIHGLINEFEDINYLPDSTLYRANVVPRIWQLGLFETNEVYLNESIQDTLTVILEEADFIQGQDFRFELARTYRKWPFRLQYNETHLAYLQRIIEREGIYYYFEQSDSGEVLVFCDNNQALPNISQAKDTRQVVFQPSSGLNVVSQANTINSIICKRQTLPKKVTLRDFNDETPSLDIRGTHIINNQGVGEINLYGLNITSPEEGQQLAEIHANAYLSRQKKLYW